MEDLDSIFDEDLKLDEPIDSGEADNESILDTEDLFKDSTNSNSENNALLDEYLKSRGVEDSKVTILDDNEDEKEVNFYELDKDEQLEILNSISQDELDANLDDLDDSEIELLNHLRSNNLSVTDFLENYKQSVIEELGVSSTQNYDIDAYDDSELYMLDLKNKYDLSDEELVKELEKELQDEVLFKKKTDILRTEYKQLEDQYNETQQVEFEQQKAQQYDEFSDTMTNVALQTPEFYGIELEDDEKNEVLSFLLDLDESGTSDFYKSLNDPHKLYEAAWFLRYGKESFDALKHAYESEIKTLKKQDKSSAIIRQQSQDSTINSIDQLNF